MSIFDFITVRPFTPLQQHVATLGVCPKCHTKTLSEKHADAGYTFNQCRTCLGVYVLEASDIRKLPRILGSRADDVA